MSDMPKSESSERIETRFDLKWICILCSVTIFVWWFGYTLSGIYYTSPQSIYKVLTTLFSTIFLFFDISALTAATIYASGIKNKKIHYASVILFILSMIFLFLVYATVLLHQAGFVK